SDAHHCKLSSFPTRRSSDLENIILVYAFNATGKTRLSVAYKNFTKSENEGNHTGVYYNAFSEDLFIWENDEDNYNENIRLNILRSEEHTSDSSHVKISYAVF